MKYFYHYCAEYTHNNTKNKVDGELWLKIPYQEGDYLKIRKGIKDNIKKIIISKLRIRI